MTYLSGNLLGCIDFHNGVKAAFSNVKEDVPCQIRILAQKTPDAKDAIELLCVGKRWECPNCVCSEIFLPMFDNYSAKSYALCHCVKHFDEIYYNFIVFEQCIELLRKEKISDVSYTKNLGC